MDRGSKRVLVVEDDQDLREMMSEVFSLSGYEVVTASDGSEALELLREEPVDLVVLDLMMPGMSGWEFRSAQLRDPSIADVPVLVLSAAAGAGDVPAAGYIAKPFELDELLSTTAQLAG